MTTGWLAISRLLDQITCTWVNHIWIPKTGFDIISGFRQLQMLVISMMKQVFYLYPRSRLKLTLGMCNNMNVCHIWIYLYLLIPVDNKSQMYQICLIWKSVSTIIFFLLSYFLHFWNSSLLIWFLLAILFCVFFFLFLLLCATQCI